MQILVGVASETGRTARMATALCEGAADAGAEAVLRHAAEVQESDLLAADALVVGSGVHMGGIESAMRQLFERMAPLWLQGRLIGKLGAAFVTAGSGGRGGGELALLSLLAALAEHGLVLVTMPNRLEGFSDAGCHWGPLAWTNPRHREPGPTEAHLVAARAHGRHVAESTARWLAGAEGKNPKPAAPESASGRASRGEG